MPFVVPCPACQTRLKLPDHLKGSGKSVKCPKCSAAVKVPDEVEDAPAAAPTPEPAPTAARSEVAERPRARKHPVDEDDDDDDEEEEERPRRKKKRAKDEDDERPRKKRRPADEDDEDDDDEDDEDEDDDDEDDDDRPRRRKPEEPPSAKDWKNCRIGILLVYLGANLVLAALSIAQLTFTAVFLLAWLGVDLGTLKMLAEIFGDVTPKVLTASGLVSGLVGVIFCCFVPPRNSAHVFAIVSASLAGGWLLFLIIALFTASPVIKILATLLAAATLILYFFFMRGAALTLKERGVADACRNLAIAFGVSLVAYPLLFYAVVRITTAVGLSGLLSDLRLRPDTIALSVGIPIVLVIIFGVGLFLALFMWFMMNLTAIYDAINYVMGKGRRREVAVWIPLLGAAAFFFIVNFIIALVAIMSVERPKKPSQTQLPAVEQPFRAQVSPRTTGHEKRTI